METQHHQAGWGEGNGIQGEKLQCFGEIHGWSVRHSEERAETTW